MMYKKHPTTGNILVFENINAINTVASGYMDATQAEIDGERLIELKVNYTKAIDAERDFILNNGLVIIQTQSNVNWAVKIDRNTSNTISNYESRSETSFVFENENPKNTDVILTKTDLLAYLNAVKVYHTIPNPKHLYSIAGGLRAQIEACTTLAELEDLIFPATPIPFITNLAQYRNELNITSEFNDEAWYDIFEVGKRPDWWSFI